MPPGKRPRLVLGTAQLGMPYGAANRTGMLSDNEAVAILHAAVDAGVTCVDTARGYGESERRIGLAFRGLKGAPAVVTKLDPLAAVPAGDVAGAVAAARESVHASLAALQCDRIDTLLLHRAVHLGAWGGAVWEMLLESRRIGLVDALGVSVQSPAELIDSLAHAEVSHIQLPFNIVDRRWETSGALGALAQRPDVTVHARSVYLQGLLLTDDPRRWPRPEQFDPTALIVALRRTADELGRTGVADLAIAFATGHDWLDGIVVGLESLDQLADNRALFARPPLTRSEMNIALAGLPTGPEWLTDPAQWHAPRGAREGTHG